MHTTIQLALILRSNPETNPLRVVTTTGVAVSTELTVWMSATAMVGPVGMVRTLMATSRKVMRGSSLLMLHHGAPLDRLDLILRVISKARHQATTANTEVAWVMNTTKGVSCAITRMIAPIELRHLQGLLVFTTICSTLGNVLHLAFSLPLSFQRRTTLI
jgi:hypothetical protein